VIRVCPYLYFSPPGSLLLCIFLSPTPRQVVSSLALMLVLRMIVSCFCILRLICGASFFKGAPTFTSQRAADTSVIRFFLFFSGIVPSPP